MKAFTFFLVLASVGFTFQSKAMSGTVTVNPKFSENSAVSSMTGIFLPPLQMDAAITIDKFNKNSMVIHYQLPVATATTVSLYDLAGNRIESVVNAVLPPGDYIEEYPINKNLIPGIYFVTIESGNLRLTRKIGIQ